MRVKICRKNVRCIMRGIKITRYFSIRIFTEDLICHCLSKNFFEQIPAFWQKNVRCTVGGAHDAVNKNFTIAWVSILRKNVRCKVREIKIKIKIYRKFHLRCHHLSKNCPFSVKLKNFFDRIPAFWRKNVRCNMKGIFSFTENLQIYIWSFDENLSV